MRDRERGRERKHKKINMDVYIYTRKYICVNISKKGKDGAK